MSVLVIENSDRVPAGRLASALLEAGVEVATVSMYEGEQPEQRAWEGVVVLGGHMGAYDDAEYRWLEPEMAFIRWIMEEEIPLLGICLGSQLTAHAIGGRAYLGPRPEVGFVDLQLSEAGQGDPVVSHISGPVLAVHRDTFDLPPGAELLATSDRYPHAYRVGSALGLQFHPEAGLEIVQRWVAAGGLDQLATSAGTTLDQLLEEVEAREAETDAAAKRLFNAWLVSEVL